MADFRRFSPPRSTEIPIEHKRRYHVFLSFRGPDVRYNLVDHLFQSLSTAGLHVFLDSERLEKGENIEMNLLEAIQNSTIHIPIFSPDYASSPWCLKELSFMWASRSSVDSRLIPLFYKVDPSDVRYPDKKGPYSDALQRHRGKGRYASEEMDAWKEALHQVSLLSGWSLADMTLGGEGKFVKQIVMELLRILNINCLHVAKSPVGLKARMEDVIKLLEIDDNCRLFVGIWGMGGLGKTTLSKAVYNEIHHLFEASCFVSDIRDSSVESIKGLRNLQRQILKDLVKVETKLNSTDHGKIQMRNHLASIKALVILDDIDSEEQLDALVGDWYGPGSRIIITTRDIQVLKTRKVDVIYPMKGLDQHEGVELFSWHAFLRASPEEGYEDMSERIVNACEGLPLSLEILGAHLYGKSDRRYWSEALKKIHNVGPVGYEKVYKTLKISYDALNVHEKQIFLDIACFFIMLHNYLFHTDSIEFHIKFWEAVGCEAVYTSLKNLEGKSLIVIDKHFRLFWMHDHLRDLGRRIVEEESCNKPSQRSRLWLKEDVVSVMEQREEMPSVRGLKWKGDLNPRMLHQIDSFASMHNLKFLFCWGLHLKKEIAMLPPNLRYLVLSDCKLEEEGLLSQIIRTESDESSGFSNNEHSFRLPHSLGQLKFLRYLDMSDTKLLHLPDEVGELNSLEELYLNGCCLSGLPQNFGNLTSLKVLDISGSLVYTFPANFKKLRSLSELTIEYCENLEGLPSLPKGLVNLNAGHCCKLQNISKILKLTKLKNLDLSFCRSIVQLPKLDFMHSLRKLKLDYCEELLELPAFPEGLTDLTARSCYKLQKLSSMSHMRDLNILVLSSCKSLTKLPSLVAMHSLRKLTLESCHKLEELPSLPEDLHNLNCSHCCNLHKIFIISDVRKLETLDLSFCPRLTELPRLDCLHSLKILNCSHCCNLQKVSFMCDAGKLETLDLSFCASLKHLPNLDCLHFLREFKIQDCEKLEDLPALPGSLINLDATRCCKLQKISSVCHMRYLETLDLSCCKSLAHLPQLDNLLSLRNLTLSFCYKLEELPDLPEGLINLNVGHCYRMQNMSSVSQTRNLRTLELSICDCLIQLPQLECLQSLKKLTLYDWDKLEELPALPGGLINFNATHCYKLQKMLNISSMRYMETLDLSFCSSLAQLPELKSMYYLKKLSVEHCEKIEKLPSLPVGLIISMSYTAPSCRKFPVCLT